MPSTRKQKANSRKSREMDILFEYGIIDVMLGGCISNSIEKVLDSMINGPVGHHDTHPLPNTENSSQENEIRDIENRNGSVRQEGLSESINILSDEMNARFSHQMDSLMALKQFQINKAISSAINDRVFPEIQIIMGNLPLNRGGLQLCTSLNGDSIGNAWINKITKLTKKDSRSACDLREDTDFAPYTQ